MNQRKNIEVLVGKRKIQFSSADPAEKYQSIEKNIETLFEKARTNQDENKRDEMEELHRVILMLAIQNYELTHEQDSSKMEEYKKGKEKIKNLIDRFEKIECNPN